MIWTGGTTNGRGADVRLGVFWDKRRWLAHRWAALHIHGMDIEGKEVICECDDTLCVEHVRAIVPLGNTRQFYLLKSMGLMEEEQEPIRAKRPRSPVPFYTEPEWLLPFIPEAQRVKVDPDAIPF